MIGQLIQGFFDIFRFHKFKIFFVLLAAAVCGVLFFPYDDLSEVVSAMVAKQTNNQVFLQFDKMGFQILPLPALQVENVVVESSFLPPLQAASLSLAPSISGFLSFRPGFNAGINEVWSGDIDVELKTGKKTEQGVATQNIHLEIDDIDLVRANESLDLPLKLQGTLSGESKINLDPSFANQPEGDVLVNIKELRFPSGTVPTQMGPIALPGLSWSNIQMRGRLSGGKVTIERADLGSSTDLLNGTVRGDVEMRLEPRGAGQVGVAWGAYQLVVELNVNAKVERELTYLALLSNYKSAISTGSKYKFRISGQRFGLPPSISPATGG